MAKIYNIRLNKCTKRQRGFDDVQLQEFRIVNSSVSANIFSTLALEFDVGPYGSKSILRK